jgi:hypothetical protein
MKFEPGGKTAGNLETTLMLSAWERNHGAVLFFDMIS